MMKALANSSASERILADSSVPTTSQRAQLQRKCACGKEAGPTGECEECKKKRLQGKGQNSEVGHPTTRGFMEARVGHDFAKVRVHSDARGAEPAADTDARAYRLARDGVRSRGQLEPVTTPETAPKTPSAETQATPAGNPQTPAPDTQPIPMDSPPAQGPAITVTNGWANPGG